MLQYTPVAAMAAPWLPCGAGAGATSAIMPVVTGSQATVRCPAGNGWSSCEPATPIEPKSKATELLSASGDVFPRHKPRIIP